MNLVVSSCGLCCSPGQTLETEHLEAEQTFPTMSCTFPTSAASIDEWLDALNMARYKAAFAKADVQVEKLHELSEEALVAAGVSMVGHRKRLLQAAKTLEQPKAPPPVAPEASAAVFGTRAGVAETEPMDVEMSPAPFIMGNKGGGGSGAGAGGSGSRGGGGSVLAAAGMKVSAPAGMDISDAGSLSRSMQKQPQQQKANSTSSIYIQSTLVKPDTDEVVFCIAAVIHDRIQQGEAMPAADRHRFPFFSEDNNPLYAAPAESQGGTSDHESSSDSNQKRPRREIPSEDMIFHTIRSVFECARIPAECLIVSLVYIERLIAVSNCPVLVTSWRPILLSALILAQKVWDDRSLHNVDFSVFCPMFTLKEINVRCCGYHPSPGRSQHLSRCWHPFPTPLARCSDLSDFLSYPPSLLWLAENTVP